MPSPMHVHPRRGSWATRNWLTFKGKKRFLDAVVWTVYEVSKPLQKIIGPPGLLAVGLDANNSIPEKTCLTLIVPNANSVSPLKIAVANRLMHAIHKNCIVYLFL